jgi:CheY-like chemotaxis protein
VSRASKKNPTPNDFLVLLAEDGLGVRRDMRNALEEIDGVFVVEADSYESACAVIDRHYVDAAVVDLSLKGVRTAGLDVIDRLREREPRARVVIASAHLKDGQLVRRFMGSRRVVKVLDKEREDVSGVAPPIAAAAARWRAGSVSVEDGDLALRLLWEHRDRFPSKLRKTKRELGRELDRVYRELFGGVRGLEDAEAAVAFRKIEREGLSAAITVEGQMTFGRDADGGDVQGVRCVVKAGPIDDIRKEVERYEHFVKFGVRLAQRVELLGYSYQGLLGGIAYSFAGGVFGQSLVSFDQLLQRRDSQHLTMEAIERLFDPNDKNWYGVRCAPTAPRAHLAATYGTDFEECFKKLHQSLVKLQGKFSGAGMSLSEAGPDQPGSLVFRGGRLTIPPTNLSGIDELYQAWPSCLVHGDMHGGNVMVELGSRNGAAIDPGATTGLKRAELKRVCLIDYGSAGPGPRTLDAVALQASVRLSDSSAIADAIQPGATDEELKGDELAAALEKAGNRAQAEARQLQKAWDVPADGRPVSGGRSAPWAAAGALLTARMRLTFPDMDRNEYLAMAIPYAIRQMGYDIAPLARVRLLAWLSAMYTMLVPDQRA